MSRASQIIAAILLIAVPTVEFGGLSLLAMLSRRTPGYLDNPLRQNMFRAGHAHAGVWIVFALVALLWVDQTDFGEPLKWVIRLAFAVAPILMPLGFFLSVTRPDAQRPNGVIALVYVAGLALGVGAVTLGVGLLTSG
jgi:heme/copper-type cytochrome/quinol oxidase subunit 4